MVIFVVNVRVTSMMWCGTDIFFCWALWLMLGCECCVLLAEMCLSMLVLEREDKIRRLTWMLCCVVFFLCCVLFCYVMLCYVVLCCVLMLVVICDDLSRIVTIYCDIGFSREARCTLLVGWDISPVAH